MTAHECCTTAGDPAGVTIDWIWGTPRGYIISVEGHAFGPMSFNDLRCFPRWLFRRLFELRGYPKPTFPNRTNLLKSRWRERC
jgi:hypothetical protein